ncbi:MAG: thioredoxin-like protein [Piptocephalis tieghemiana]|nr:MAG: thioredoxin-like protein [Piptocephalis tieghemiana]
MSTRLTSTGKNGVGAFVLQCRKMVFHYCERSGSSAGMRDYLTRQLVPFARSLPQVEVVVSPRPSKHPCIRGFYLNGQEKTVCVRGKTATEVGEYAKMLRDTSGERVRDLRKVPVLSDTPSVRGIWNPFVAKPHKL